MLAHLLEIVFGGHWSLKQRCIKNNGLRKRLYILLYSYVQSNHSASIAWNSGFAGEPCLPHGLHGIFISGEAKIGRNCVIFQQVTIGSSSLIDSKSIGAPRIGDNCYIGAGAKIIGNVKVGSDVRIGANAVVHKDVPDNCVVVSGNQLNIYRENRLNNRLYSWRGQWVYFDDGRLVEEDDKVILGVLNSAFGKNSEV